MVAVLHRRHRKRQQGDYRKLVLIGVLVTLIALTALLMQDSAPPMFALLASKNWPELAENTMANNNNDGSSSNNSKKGSMQPVLYSNLKRQRHSQENVTVKSLTAHRQDFEKACRDNRTSKDELMRLLFPIFKPPPPTSLNVNATNEDPVKPCMYTFIDLGANVGDSLGKFIDAAFPSNCPSLEGKKRLSRPRYSITRGFMSRGKVADLADVAKSRLKMLSRQPEDYCYVGVEGNPAFTSRLKELEARVMGTIPKPVHSSHFYTETVAAPKDGPTVLYLDTVNTKKNFWGSSIIATHGDVTKSAADNNGTLLTAAKVKGVTLSSLLKRSVQRVPGAHVFLKIDIEGGEYMVMNEAIETLCDYTSAGVQVDLIMEIHFADQLGGKKSWDLVHFRRVTSKRIHACNITRVQLSTTT